MNFLTLRVGGSLPGKITLDLGLPSGNPFHVEATSDLGVESIILEPTQLNHLMPMAFTRELRRQVLSGTTTGLLAVTSENDQVDGIPWEYLSQLLELPTVFVIRQLVQREPFVEEPVPRVIRLLAAGWSGKPTFQLPGIETELNALGQLGNTEGFQVHVQVLFEPSLAELASACSTFQPDILHLIPPGINRDKAVPEMILTGDDQVKIVPIDQFLSRLPHGLRPRLVVLNSCSGGEGGKCPSAIRMIAEYLHTIAVGWLGTIEDRAAVEFARFMYARILDGETMIESLRAYRVLYSSKAIFEQATRHLRFVDQKTYDPVPVLWTPSIALLSTPLRDLRHQEVAPEPMAEAPASVARRRTMPSGTEAKPVISDMSSIPTLKVEFEPQKWLNPALLKNGRPAINSLVITADRAVRNVGVAVSCDTGHGISTVRQTVDLRKGPQPVPIETWQFPVLYELIGATVPRRQINFTVSCSLAGGSLAETTKPVLWMGHNEWLDKPDTWRFMPAFVDPYSDGVLDVIGKADDVLKTIAGPKSSFDAYQSNDSQHVMDQVKAVFNCLRGKPYEFRYIAPPPIPVYTPGDAFASGQRVRRLDEIVERCRGTCHDLAVLFASCLEHIQIYPLIILITGHTFSGFWKGSMAHEDFWTQAGKNKLRRPSDPGREWTITDPMEIQELLDRDVIALVDAVMVTDRYAKFEDALQAGSEHFKASCDTSRLPVFDVAVDIQASRRTIQPL